MNKYPHLLLVTLQVVCIVYIAATGTIIPSSAILIICEILFVLFGIWAMAEMRFRFNVFPALLKNSTLITSGPYKIVRHPMYTSIILITLIWIIDDFSYIGFCVWLLLIFILNKKTLHEEKILDKEFSEFINYKSKTKKLIPFLY